MIPKTSQLLESYLSFALFTSSSGNGITIKCHPLTTDLLEAAKSFLTSQKKLTYKHSKTPEVNTLTMSLSDE